MIPNSHIRGGSGPRLPRVYRVRHGETAWTLGARADGVIGRSPGGSVLLFGHRDVLRILAVRWVGLSPMEGRDLLLATACLSILGYDHDLAEPAIYVWNASVGDGAQETRRPPRSTSSAHLDRS